MTFFETANQSRLFLLLLYAGTAAGVLYDGCALVRRKCPRPLCVLCDAAWALLAGGAALRLWRRVTKANCACTPCWA